MAILWKTDPMHSEVKFKVKHLMITTVTGYFRKFDCEVITETEDFNSTTSIKFTAEIASIDTNSEPRDTHLKSEDFFNAEKFTQIIFTGSRFEVMGSEATLQGELTIRGITKPITLEVFYAGTAVDPSGQTKTGFSVRGRISRKEYGLMWDAVTEAGSVVVSDEVRIHAELQFMKATQN